MNVFHRYKSLISDWPAFCDAVRRPLPPCVWANTLRCGAVDLTKRFAVDGIFTQPLPWQADGLRIISPTNIGRRIEYIAGLCQVQEEIAMLPVLLLAPQPGELVLDLCAAPGNKTAQMAVAMQNTGRVIANEINRNRMRALRQIINRLGLINVVATQANAIAFPKQTQQFDRVLADVHCSCEGTSRKNPELLWKDAKSYSEKIATSQRAILIRALQLCKPGGRVVYSTCTYAPEENEMVVDAALAAVEPKIKATLLACDMPGITWSPGLERWQSREFRADMRNALRIYPHQNDTGGFFIAVIEKIADERSTSQKSYSCEGNAKHGRMTAQEAERLFGYLEKHFGMKRPVFDGMKLLRRNAKIAALQNGEAPLHVRPDAKITGLPFIHLNMKEPKLTTAGAMALGHNASKQVVMLNESQMQAFIAGTDFRLPPEQSVDSLRRGSVLVQFQKIFLGVGFFYPDDNGGKVTSQFPKAWQRIDLT